MGAEVAALLDEAQSLLQDALYPPDDTGVAETGPLRDDLPAEVIGAFRASLDRVREADVHVGATLGAPNVEEGVARLDEAVEFLAAVEGAPTDVIQARDDALILIRDAVDLAKEGETPDDAPETI